MRGAHLAFLLGALRVGGAERVVLDLAGALAARGDQVDLVLGEAPEGESLPLPASVRPIVLGVPPAVVGLATLARRLPPRMAFGSGTPRVLRATGRLRRYLERERPDALLASLRGPSLMAVWARMRGAAGTRVVVRLANHATAEARSETSPFKRGYPELIRRFYPRADRVVALSHGMADDLVANVGLPRELIEVIHNPVDVERVGALAREAPERGWPDGASGPVFVAAGRLAPQKDHATLLRAFARLCGDLDARLVILGDGDLRGASIALAGELGVAERVSFPGRVANPQAYFARASALVLSSVFEGFPNVLLEALAAGCPVVSSDCPSGPSEIVTRPELGALVPVGDPEALARAMRRVAAAPRDPATLRAHAARFDLAETADRYRQVMLGG